MLVDAEEARALERGLAVKRKRVLCGEAHLYFQRTVPSFVSSTMIPESASCWRMASARLKSRRRLGGVAFFDQRVDLFGGRCAASAGPKPSLRELFVVIIGKHGENRVEFLHGGERARRVLLQESAAVHGGVGVAHEIEDRGEGHGRVDVVREARVEIVFGLLDALH